MPRYFLELSYKGTNYAGFQKQKNANAIQQEVEVALMKILKVGVELTGSSRTDAGVHALHNYFHFDSDISPEQLESLKLLYSLNAIVPDDIVIKRIFQVPDNTHSRFDAKSREYQYFLYQSKNPFLLDRAYYYPYNLDIQKLNAAAEVLMQYSDFTSFSKKNTQVKTFECTLYNSKWTIEGDSYIYTVKANRFLRGMVKGLVGTMLKVGTGKLSLNDFNKIIQNRDCSKSDFSVPSKGLFLIRVEY